MMHWSAGKVRIFLHDPENSLGYFSVLRWLLLPDVPARNLQGYPTDITCYGAGTDFEIQDISFQNQGVKAVKKSHLRYKVAAPSLRIKWARV